MVTTFDAHLLLFDCHLCQCPDQLLQSLEGLPPSFLVLLPQLLVGRSEVGKLGCDGLELVDGRDSIAVQLVPLLQEGHITVLLQCSHGSQHCEITLGDVRRHRSVTVTIPNKGL